MSDYVRTLVSGRRSKRSPTAESIDLLPSADAYGNLIVAPLHHKQHALADEGSYFTLKTAAPGTGVAGHAAPTTLDDTKPYLLLHNGASATQTPSRRMYLDYLRLTVTAAGTGGSAVNVAFKTDAGNRRSSAGTAMTPVNANQDDSTASAIAAWVGPVVASAATSAARLQYAQPVRPVISVAQDVYTFTFGQGVQTVPALISSGTAIAHLVYNHGPLIIGPNQSLLVHIWQPAQSAASSYEVEMGFWER